MDRMKHLLGELARPFPAPIPAVMKALRLYRGRGILMTLYCQGRFTDAACFSNQFLNKTTRAGWIVPRDVVADRFKVGSRRLG